MQPQVGIIVGSTRPNRVSIHLAQWLMQQLQTPQLHFQLLDLKTIALPFLNEGDIPTHHHYSQLCTQQWSNTINHCDAIVAIFPQYNWGYPAPLKNAFDYLYDEWRNKPISLVTYGNHGGPQAMAAFKLVTTGLKMKSLAVNPQININDAMFTADGCLVDADHDLAPYQFVIHLLQQELINELIK